MHYGVNDIDQIDISVSVANHFNPMPPMISIDYLRKKTMTMHCQTHGFGVNGHSIPEQRWDIPRSIIYGQSTVGLAGRRVLMIYLNREYLD